MGSIKNELVSGVFWNAVGRYSALAVSVVVSMILARLLSPEDFGVVAIATVVITFLQIFCTMGIGPAVIQRRDLSDKDLDSIFTFSLLIGLLMAALFFLISWPVAGFYDNRQLVSVFHILSIQVFFSSANMVPNALMTRDKKFKSIAGRRLTLQSLSGILAIIAAWKGAGIYALLISPVITAIGIFIWNRTYYPIHIDWGHNTEPVKRIAGYSAYQFLYEFVEYFSRNLDKLIIGKAMNVNLLGIYEKAYRLMQMPMQNIPSVINPVLQPVLKDLQDDRRELHDSYLKIIKFISTVSFPLGIVLCGMSAEIILIFYGNQWNGAIPVFSILALSLPLQMVLSTSGSIFLVCNNTKLKFQVGVLNTVITVASFIFTALVFGTLRAMAWTWTITLCVNFVLTFHCVYKYLLRTSILPMIKQLLLPAACAVILAIILWLLDIPNYPNLIIAALIKGVISLSATLAVIHFSGQYNILKVLKRG